MTDEKLIRVNLMLSSSTLKILDDMKHLMNVSRSSLVRGLISEAEPSLRHLLTALDGFDKLSLGERAVKVSKLGEVANRLDENINTLIGEIDR